MARLFVYGTLRDPEVQLSVVGRTVQGEPDVLAGYRVSSLGLGGREYLAAVPSPEGSIAGLALSVSAAELARIDRYETAAYARTRVRLESGRAAWVYVRATVSKRARA